ncbi:ribbon-helix-helix protein, CopG family [Peribacillus huizhouensis]|uniref:CopG family nickel-responsive transcriptional regulator n=1 Tax=Peribacillus huizhouensis TaxID=1501239 RepID=A0ABR6CPC4_9BACI|nr:ribbon-helix-helix protein, CopG family [Peribacillus huizhouensis]MBA9026825.1 CopG family nickel-responsive transcriptional regulator [Peribacillus huizhouensis]
MESNLLRKLDGLVKQRGYENRSEAVRDLVRDALIQHSWEKDEQIVAGSIILFYDHHQKNLLDDLTKIQHGMCDRAGNSINDYKNKMIKILSQILNNIYLSC